MVVNEVQKVSGDTYTVLTTITDRDHVIKIIRALADSIEANADDAHHIEIIESRKKHLIDGELRHELLGRKVSCIIGMII